jgi:hypothetical protein
LIIGLDPHAVPGVDAQAVEQGLSVGLKRVADAGYAVHQVLVPPEESAIGRIRTAVLGETWDIVVIGGGIRKPEPLLEFFEAVVNVVHVGAPTAKIAFNANGGTSLEAIARVTSRAVGGTNS